MNPLLELPAFLTDARQPLPCASYPKLFHTPDDGRTDTGSVKTNRIAAAKFLCGQCPVQAACRAWARTSRETGVWGGESEEEREAAGYRRAKLPGEDRPDCGTEAGAKWHRRYGTGKPCDSCAYAELEASRVRRRRRDAKAMTQWPPHLTPVEKSVLEQAATGRPNNQIAVRLGVRTKTVTSTVYRLRIKLRTDNEGLAAKARELGLLSAAADFSQAA